MLMGDFALVDLGDGTYAFVDAEDWPRVSRHAWRAREDGYVQRTWAEGGRTRHELLHHFVMRGRVRPGEVVDHAFGERWNCRKACLRVATGRENSMNRAPLTGKEYKGVAPHRGRWKARIKTGGRSVHLGVYDTPEMAAMAYDEAARQLFGEFARLNFPAGPVDAIP